MSYPAYTLTGRLGAITDGRDASGVLSNTATFTYDLGRLKTVTDSPNLNATYDYDSLGNIRLKEGTTFTYSSTKPKRDAGCVCQRRGTQVALVAGAPKRRLRVVILDSTVL